MNCAKCPHRELIEKARACCLACDPDSLSHKGRSHVQANDFTLRHAVNDHAPTTGVTNLSPEDEDKLRRAMSSLFGLDPVDLLLVQHLFSGGRLSTFDDCMIRVSNRLARYHGSPRAMAHAAKERIARAFPQIAPVFRHVVTTPADAARADSIDGRLDLDRVQPDLFEQGGA